MTMFTQFETEENLEQKGVWADYGEFKVLIGRAGGSNKKYLSYAEKATKPYRRAIQMGALPEERMKSILFDIFANSVVLDWQVTEPNGNWVRGIHKKGGGILEFTPENVILTFKLLPALFIDIQNLAEGVSLFKKEEMDADSKN